MNKVKYFYLFQNKNTRYTIINQKSGWRNLGDLLKFLIGFTSIVLVYAAYDIV